MHFPGVPLEERTLTPCLCECLKLLFWMSSQQSNPILEGVVFLFMSKFSTLLVCDESCDVVRRGQGLWALLFSREDSVPRQNTLTHKLGEHFCGEELPLIGELDGDTAKCSPQSEGILAGSYSKVFTCIHSL